MIWVNDCTRLELTTRLDPLNAGRPTDIGVVLIAYAEDTF